MRFLRIAVLPGDGIGREVVAEGVKALRAVEERLEGIRFELREFDAGAEAFLRSGEPMSEKAWEACRNANAVLLGAMGLPDVRWPDGREIAPQLDLRRPDLYCGIRPVRLYHAADSPLKWPSTASIDMVIVRENTEGLFSTRKSQHGPSPDTVCDELRVTRHGSERLFHAAFRLARSRRRKITLVDKAHRPELLNDPRRAPGKSPCPESLI